MTVRASPCGVSPGPSEVVLLRTGGSTPVARRWGRAARRGSLAGSEWPGAVGDSCCAAAAGRTAGGADRWTTTAVDGEPASDVPPKVGTDVVTADAAGDAATSAASPARGCGAVPASTDLWATRGAVPVSTDLS